MVRTQQRSGAVQQVPRQPTAVGATAVGGANGSNVQQSCGSRQGDVNRGHVNGSAAHGARRIVGDAVTKLLSVGTFTRDTLSHRMVMLDVQCASRGTTCGVNAQSSSSEHKLVDHLQAVGAAPEVATVAGWPRLPVHKHERRGKHHRHVANTCSTLHPIFFRVLKTARRHRCRSALGPT